MKKDILKRFVAVLICIITAFSVVSIVPFTAFAADNTVVTTDSVRLRSSAKITSDNILATLSKAEKLTLVSNSSGDWAKVKRSNGTIGYCSIDYLSVPSSSAVKFTGTTTDSVNLRKGASTSYDSIKVLSKGTAFTVKDNSNELWVKVTADSSTGYVYRTYTSLKLTVADSGSADKPVVPETKPVAPPKETQPAPTKPATTPATKPETNTAVSTIKPNELPNWYNSSYLDKATGRKDADSLTPLRGEVALSAEELNLNVGDTYNLAVFAAGGILDTSAKFSTSDKSVVTVTTIGYLKAIKAGKAVISATINGKTLKCSVTVSKAVEEPAKPTITLSKTSISIEAGNSYILKASDKKAVWSSSNSSVAKVSTDGVVTGVKEGSAIITATANGEKATCKVTVKAKTTGITIKYADVTITSGKTFYNSASSSTSVTWTSSDTSIAKVSGGYITAVSKGVAIITAKSSAGSKTCLVTVTDAAPIRFVYSYPNTAAKNENIQLVAITDKTRTAVQFKVDVNGTVKTVNATSKKADENTVVWTGKVALNTAGTFNVTAYSKTGNKYTTCDDAKTTVFVRANKDLNKETNERRRASDELIKLISEFEGYSGNVYFDELAGGIPTLGYGKVVYPGDYFYNDMTKTEAYALLTDTVNTGGYASNVDSYLQSLNANYNQHQFDALVSFAYNIGYYGLKSDTEIRALILAAVDKTGTTTADKTAAYVNGTQVNLRSGAGTSHKSLGWVNYPDKLTLLDTKLVNGSWYHVKTESGTEGYIYKDYVSLGVVEDKGKIYLSLINKAEFTRVLLEYHHASSNCIYGLLYRRVDELDLFYYGDYARDGRNNKYKYSFVCKKDNSVYI